MHQSYGTSAGSHVGSAAGALTQSRDTSRTSSWLSKVYGIFGLQVSFVSVIGLILMLNDDLRSSIQDMNALQFWVPAMIFMTATMLLLHSYYDESPANIYAQFAYLLTWGSALAVVSCSYYPGPGVLLIPGMLCLGGGFLFLSVVAHCTTNSWAHGVAITVLSSIPFEILVWSNKDQFDDDAAIDPAVCIALCNLFLVAVEAYLVWKTEKSLEEHGHDQVWNTTADLLLASFGVPAIFPCQIIVLKLGWNCCGSRYLEGKKKEDTDASG